MRFDQEKSDSYMFDKRIQNKTNSENRHLVFLLSSEFVLFCISLSCLLVEFFLIKELELHKS